MNNQEQKIFEVGILGKVMTYLDHINSEVYYNFLPVEPSVKLTEFIKSKPLPRIKVSLDGKLTLTISATYLGHVSVVLGQIDFSGAGKDYDELKESILGSLEIMVSNMIGISGTVSIMPKCSFLSKQGYVLPSFIIRKNGDTALEFWVVQEGSYIGSRLCGKLQLGVLTDKDL